MPPAAVQGGEKEGKQQVTDENFNTFPKTQSYPHQTKAKTPRQVDAPAQNHDAKDHTSSDQTTRKATLPHDKPFAENLHPCRPDQPMPADNCVTHTFLPANSEVKSSTARSEAPDSAAISNAPPPTPPAAANDEWDVLQNWEARSRTRTSTTKELPQDNLVDEGHRALRVDMGKGVAHTRALNEVCSSCKGSPSSPPVNSLLRSPRSPANSVHGASEASHGETNHTAATNALSVPPAYSYLPMSDEPKWNRKAIDPMVNDEQAGDERVRSERTMQANSHDNGKGVWAWLWAEGRGNSNNESVPLHAAASLQWQ